MRDFNKGFLCGWWLKQTKNKNIKKLTNTINKVDIMGNSTKLQQKQNPLLFHAYMRHLYGSQGVEGQLGTKKKVLVGKMKV